MAPSGAGRSSSVLLSLCFQFLLTLTSVYFVFYFLFTLGLIIRKSLLLSYPADALACDVVLLFLMATVGSVHCFCGVKGNLEERSHYILANVLLTVISIGLALYFLTSQTYVMRADVIIGSILVAAYGVGGLVALSILARLVSLFELFIRVAFIQAILYTSHDVVTSSPGRNESNKSVPPSEKMDVVYSDGRRPKQTQNQSE